MKAFYSDEYVAAGHSFDTTRKAQWIAGSIREHPVHDCELVAPVPLTREDLVGIHWSSCTA